MISLFSLPENYNILDIVVFHSSSITASTEKKKIIKKMNSDYAIGTVVLLSLS